MYSSANGGRFFNMFGLTQKGGTMERKISRLHNPHSASISFSNPCEKPFNSFAMSMYKSGCERKIYTVKWQKNTNTDMENNNNNVYNCCWYNCKGDI